MFGSAVTSGGYLTYVTVVQPNGTTTNYSQPGTIYNGPVVGPDGSVYQTSTTGTDGYDSTRYTTVLQVLRSDGTTVRYTQPGTLNSNFQPVIGADGGVYQLSSTGISSGPITVLQVVRPNGTSTQYTHPGSSSDNVVFAPNGTAYQVTSTYNNADQSSATVVTAVNPNGITTEYALNGSGTVKFGPNNTAFLNGYVINPNASTQGGESYVPRLTKLNPDDTIFRTAYTSTGGVAVNVLRPNGSTTTTVISQDQPFNPLVVGPNGSAYQRHVMDRSASTCAGNPGWTDTAVLAVRFHRKRIAVDTIWTQTEARSRDCLRTPAMCFNS